MVRWRAGEDYNRAMPTRQVTRKLLFQGEVLRFVRLDWIDESSAIVGSSADWPAVDVYLARSDELTAPALLAACESLLSDDELERCNTFRRPEVRNTFLLSHALTRCMLSRHAQVAPAAWRFTTNRFGRPEIAAPVVDLHFNLTHTPGLIAVAVAQRRDVGIDAEWLSRRAPLEVMPKVFATDEIEAVERLDGALQVERFFALWTLKEAYAKARGRGFWLSFPEIVFDLDAAGPIRLIRSDEPSEEACKWQFALYRAGREHLLATAYAGQPGSAPLAMRVTEVVPRLA